MEGTIDILKIGPVTFKVVLGDITQLEVEAAVEPGGTSPLGEWHQQVAR